MHSFYLFFRNRQLEFDVRRLVFAVNVVNFKLAF